MDLNKTLVESYHRRWKPPPRVATEGMIRSKKEMVDTALHRLIYCHSSNLGELHALKTYAQESKDLKN
jgi:hypothetical protein